MMPHHEMTTYERAEQLRADKRTARRIALAWIAIVGVVVWLLLDRSHLNPAPPVVSSYQQSAK